jgi:hypothetical protein
MKWIVRELAKYLAGLIAMAIVAYAVGIEAALSSMIAGYFVGFAAGRWL